MVIAHIPKTNINGKSATHVINLRYCDNHYVMTRSLSRLLRTQITTHK